MLNSSCAATILLYAPNICSLLIRSFPLVKTKRENKMSGNLACAVLLKF